MHLACPACGGVHPTSPVLCPKHKTPEAFARESRKRENREVAARLRALAAAGVVVIPPTVAGGWVAPGARYELLDEQRNAYVILAEALEAGAWD